MQLTAEQEAIIQSTGNIKINAVAGSGKTTTVIEYARTRPPGSRILYIAFNKSVRLEAQQKFAKAGLRNVQIETAHSLAYKHIVFNHRYQVRAQGYKTQEIARLLALEGTGEKHAEYMMANHVNKFVTYFCNSPCARVQELNYLETIYDEKARKFVHNIYPYLEKQTRHFLAMMDRHEIEITHDFYLKKFQLSRPALQFDYILFDEGQDASAAMLDIFLQQPATKVIVGDAHQQIYGWRFAVNSLEKVDFKNYHLSTSFRFDTPIAELAMNILAYKDKIEPQIPVKINGAGRSIELISKAIIARTNLGLLLRAIEHVTDWNQTKKIYFEGNINSYTYADEGTSLYDVLNLFLRKPKYIRDPLIQAMKNMDELKEYIDKTEDHQLAMMVEIVEEYGDEIPVLINKIKSLQVDGEKKEEAAIIFSTLHKCKGMEYDVVELANDFITEEKLEKQVAELEKNPREKPRIIEEINLLYVAVTRAKCELHIPENLLPAGTLIKPPIFITNDGAETPEPSNVFKPQPYKPKKAKPADGEKAYDVSTIRQQKKGAYLPWTAELDEQLTTMFCEGKDIHEMADHFGRTKGAIQSRIKKLELFDLYG